MKNNHNQPTIEMADILRQHYSQLSFLTPEQLKVVNAIISCRTVALGGHVLVCDHCKQAEISYNSCRNRHCPKCGFLKREKWILAREKDLLPVTYFHTVFTIPRSLASIGLQNKKLFYSLLFKATSQTLKEVAANPKNLGAHIGFISVLHTWDQKLLVHPHIHCIVPGGGIDDDKKNWINSSKNFFLCVKILASVFRGKFLSFLEKSYHSLTFHGSLSHLTDYSSFKKLLDESCKTNWVVYSKKPFAGPKQVINYLGRYTHRIAISNYRIIAANEDTVTFSWRDRRDNNNLKTMTLNAITFIKRFLLHILPTGFMKIRHYGIFANSVRKATLSLCEDFFKIEKGANNTPILETWQDIIFHVTGEDPTLCQFCKIGHMVKVNDISSLYRPPPSYSTKAG